MNDDEARRLLDDFVHDNSDVLLPERQQTVDGEPTVITGAVLLIKTTSSDYTETLSLRGTPGLPSSSRIGMLWWALDAERESSDD